MTGRDKRRGTEPTGRFVGEQGPELAPRGDVPAGQMIAWTDDGRPRCIVDGCVLPEVIDNAGLCGGHYATRPDLRKGARRDR